MNSDYPRDLVGYGSTPPDPAWPDDARIAVQIVINYEEGSEYSFPDGDGRSETRSGEMPTAMINDSIRDLAMESMFEYGSRAGFWRLMRLLQARDVPATIFGCALALERNPEAAQAISAAGFDVCCHGWRWEEHFRMDEDEERRAIRKAVESIKATMGERPMGWYCRYGPSVNTRRLVVEEGGFLYDSDAYNDDLPYWVKVDGRDHLVVPYTLDANDVKFASGALGTGDEFHEYLRNSFDYLYHEGKTTPKMMSVGLHTRIAGRPGRAEGLAKFLDYVQGHENVWLCRRIDIAQHWQRVHPPTGTGNPGGGN